VRVPKPVVSGSGVVTAAPAGTATVSLGNEVASLPAEVEKNGVEGLSAVKLLIMVIVVLVMVGVPLATIFMPTPTQTVVGGEESPRRVRNSGPSAGLPRAASIASIGPPTAGGIATRSGWPPLRVSSSTRWTRSCPRPSTTASMTDPTRSPLSSSSRMNADSLTPASSAAAMIRPASFRPGQGDRRRLVLVDLGLVAFDGGVADGDGEGVVGPRSVRDPGPAIGGNRRSRGSSWCADRAISCAGAG
jgi:hypothetical protein